MELKIFMTGSNQKINTAPELLRLKSVSKAFGGLQALYDISFTVSQGNIYGLIGPNGAGKTTLFNLITGVIPPDEGQILFAGNPIHGKEIHQVVSAGIARTFQNVELFASLTALENVMVGCHVRSKSGLLSAIARLPQVHREEAAIRKKAMELLSFVGLADQADQQSKDLPLGWQRLLEIARALGSEPNLLLLDEPAAGLNTVETQSLGKIIYNIKQKGITMILVEHDMSLTMKISDHIIVLDQGRKLAEGTPKEIQCNELVMAAYLGNSE